MREDNGQHPVIYALWVGSATAIVDPYLILAAFYRLSDLMLLLVNQVRTPFW